MALFKVSGQLNVVFDELEIEADSKEEALRKLWAMDATEIMEDCCIRDVATQEEKAELYEAELRFHVHHITYDIDEEDLEDNEMTEEEIIAALPTEMDVKIYAYADDDFDDLIADEISDKTGWCVRNFQAELDPDQYHLLEK